MALSWRGTVDLYMYTPPSQATPTPLTCLCGGVTWPAGWGGGGGGVTIRPLPQNYPFAIKYFSHKVKFRHKTSFHHNVNLCQNVSFRHKVKFSSYKAGLQLSGVVRGVLLTLPSVVCSWSRKSSLYESMFFSLASTSTEVAALHDRQHTKMTQNNIGTRLVCSSARSGSGFNTGGQPT